MLESIFNKVAIQFLLQFSWNSDHSFDSIAMTKAALDDSISVD